MKKITLLSGLLALTLSAAGCTTGLFYTHTVQPLTHDMHATPLAQSGKHGSVEMISLPPFTGFYKLVAWGSAAIGDVAKKEGLQEVYHADLEILSVLSVYNRYTIHVYGR